MTSTEVVEGGEAGGSAVEFAKCECCGWTEECTVEYMAGVKASHHGRWICGLCAEAVKDEIFRSDKLITIEEALDRHTTFRSFSPPQNPTTHLILALRRLMRRRFESPTADGEMRVVPSPQNLDREGTVSTSTGWLGMLPMTYNNPASSSHS